MNPVNRLKNSAPTSQYCAGNTTKKANTKLRWSPRRVGDNVKNSRKAKNDTRPKSQIATHSPAIQPIQKTIIINQLVRSTPSMLRSS